MTPDVRNLDLNEAINQALEVAPQGVAGVSETCRSISGHLSNLADNGKGLIALPERQAEAGLADSQISPLPVVNRDFAGEEAQEDTSVSSGVGASPAIQVSRGHGAQGDPATAATLGHALAFETAAGIPLEALAEFNDEGETGRNAAGRAAIARKMQRIAAGGPNHYSHDELVSTVARAERGELR